MEIPPDVDDEGRIIIRNHYAKPAGENQPAGSDRLKRFRLKA
jgi:hypothetical protein